MAYAYYPKLWQKAFLIEILRKDSGALVKSFAFSLPPEAVRVEVPQRVNVTKTFGGVFVDDYGVDTAQISLSGSTGNGDIKEVYSNGASAYMTGKSEAYYILEEIIHYKYKQADYDKFEMRLYDLSSAPSAFTAGLGAPISLNIDGWVVVLKEGQIARSKDKPFFYSYTLNFIGIEPIGKKKYKYEVAYQQPAVERVFGFFDRIRSGSQALRRLLANYRNIIGWVSRIEEWTNTFEAEVRAYYRVVQGFIDTTVDGINSVFDIVSFPADLALELLDFTQGLRNAVEGEWQNIVESWQAVEDRYNNVATMAKELVGIEDAVSGVVATSKSAGALPKAMIVPRNSPGANPAVDTADPAVSPPFSVLLSYGYYAITATSETRLDVLSVQAYGTPDYADSLAAFNGITGDSEIEAGMEIKIPFLTNSPAIQGNEVYDTSGQMYGSDIRLDEVGDLVLAEFNDYAIVGGLDNMGQAIHLRLAERSGARVRLDAYGISMEGGGYDAFSLSVLLSSIRETLQDDPRIRTVSNFIAESSGDGLTLRFSAELEAGGKANFSINI